MPRLIAALLVAVALAGPVAAETRVPTSQGEIALSFAPVVRRAAPAVVNIYATRMVARRATPFADDPFFGPLFRDFGPAQPRMQNSLGSGVILSADGLVVSNYHVVGEAQDIRVVLNDRREFAADILLADEESDLAVLRLRGAEDLPALAMRDSDGLEVGELVLAIGNPFGVGQTVTSGIVSGLARSGAATGSARGWFIQTDAAINPGNSGGALVDIEGRLVGINTSILTRSGGSNGIGFAIPSNLVARMLALAEAGATRFERPWAGIGGQPVTGDLAEGLGLDRPEGFLVSEVHPESPFARAGIEVGDVILGLDGVAVSAPQDLIYRLSVAGPGGRVAVEYFRDGQRRDAVVALDAVPRGDAPAAPQVVPAGPLAGLALADLGPRLRNEFGLPPEAAGALVLDPGPGMGRGGLRPGDLILAVNGSAVRGAADVLAAAAEGGRLWYFEVVRDARRMRLIVRV
jgi:Do/DeqQ family serine protease